MTTILTIARKVMACLRAECKGKLQLLCPDLDGFQLTGDGGNVVQQTARLRGARCLTSGVLLGGSVRRWGRALGPRQHRSGQCAPSTQLLGAMRDPEPLERQRSAPPGLHYLPRRRSIIIIPPAGSAGLLQKEKTQSGPTRFRGFGTALPGGRGAGGYGTQQSC